MNTTEGTTTELDGSFIIQNIKPGIYDIEVSYLGYETVSLFEIEVQGAKPTILQFSINETSKQLDEITIKASNFKKQQKVLSP